jgi:hypothetical protein
VNVNDPPGIPEKKSFPPRLWVTLLLTFFVFACTSAVLLARHYWFAISESDPRKELAAEVFPVLRHRVRALLTFGRSAA